MYQYVFIIPLFYKSLLLVLAVGKSFLIDLRFQSSGISSYLTQSHSRFFCFQSFAILGAFPMPQRQVLPCPPPSVAILPQVHEWSNSVE